MSANDTRTQTYHVEQLSTASTQRITTDAAGLATQTVIAQNGTTTTTMPNGTVTTETDTRDPRFGLQSPVRGLTVHQPSGLTLTQAATRAVTLANPDDLLSLLTQTDTLTVNGRTATSTYTAATRTSTTTSPAGRQTTTITDALGRPTSVQVAGLLPVLRTYDARGRLASIAQGSRATTFGYGAGGFLASITDALNRTIGLQYDLGGRITQQTLPDGRVITFGYDANGNVTSITPPGRPAHLFGYTPADLQSIYDPPDPQPLIPDPRTLYTYNLDRQLTRITRPDGLLIDFLYDLAGRLSTQVLPGNQSVSYSYDPTTGNVITITAPDGGTLSFTYDGNLLLSESWAGTVAGSVSRTYDNDFRVTSQSVNGSNTVNLSYDLDSLLAGSGALSVTRDPQTGLITGTTLGTVTDSSSYSAFGELASYNATANSSSVYAVQYVRDALGRIIEKTETGAGATHTYDYNYDLAGRLTDVMIDGNVTAHYEYDANSNRIGGYTAGGTISATYDDQDRLLAYGTSAYAYTANGELLTKTDANGTTMYAYDGLGNLTGVTLPDGTQVQYVIDGKNRRIGKGISGTLVQGFLYDGQLRIVAELDGSNNVVSRFVYGDKGNIPDYMVRGGVTYRLISDHLGSVRLVVNTANSSIAQRMDYDEFGNLLVNTNPGLQPFGFAGGLYDRDTKLVRFGARDYDSQTGRWSAKDTIRFGGGDTNLYGYVLSDPINGIDPNGRGLVSGLICEGIDAAFTIKAFYDLSQAADELQRIRQQIAELESSCPISGRTQSDQDTIDALKRQQVDVIRRQVQSQFQVDAGIAGAIACSLAFHPAIP